MTGNNYGGNDRLQNRKSKLMVLWGSNPSSAVAATQPTTTIRPSSPGPSTSW